LTYLGETIKPIGAGAHQSDFLRRDGVGHELVDGVRDEEIGMLDASPEVIPDLTLRRTLNMNEVTANLCINPSVVDSSAYDQEYTSIWER